MDVVRARALGTCFGVRDAVALALEERFRGSLTVLGELVHNGRVLDRLEEHGVARAASLAEPIATPAVMITAHGASEATKARARALGFSVHDATCPLVARVHRLARPLEDEGWHVAIVGKKGHVEVIGLAGDLRDATVVETEADLESLRGRPRVAFIAQSTEASARFQALVERARALLVPGGTEVRAIDTTCAPTRERQDALLELAARCDVIVVVGDRASNNSRKLVETARAHGAEAHLVAGPEALDPAWFRGKRRCGLTAGTSSPDEAIDAVERALRAMALAVGCDAPVNEAGAYARR